MFFFQSVVESRRAGDDEASDDSETIMVLPASLLEESYSASETITMTTIDQERYTCVLPDVTGDADPKVSRKTKVCLSSIDVVCMEHCTHMY